MNTFSLEAKTVTMTLQNVQLIDSTEDSSPTVVGMDDSFELSVDVLFKPKTDPLTQCLMEDGHEMIAYFGIESIGKGIEIQLVETINTHTGKFKYTILTKPKTPKELGLESNTVYTFSVGVAFACPETPKSLIVGFADGYKFFIYGDR